MISLRFQIVENWANLRLLLKVQKPKVLQLQRDFAPDPLTGGSALDPAGGSPPL